MPRGDDGVFGDHGSRTSAERHDVTMVRLGNAADDRLGERVVRPRRERSAAAEGRHCIEKIPAKERRFMAARYQTSHPSLVGLTVERVRM